MHGPVGKSGGTEPATDKTGYKGSGSWYRVERDTQLQKKITVDANPYGPKQAAGVFRSDGAIELDPGRDINHSLPFLIRIHSRHLCFILSSAPSPLHPFPYVLYMYSLLLFTPPEHRPL